MATEVTGRAGLKAERRERLLAEAARLMAAHGYRGVRLRDIGTAAGISGPGVYRHFAGKEALLAELLVGPSRRLLEGALRATAGDGDPARVLAALVDAHLDFSLAEPDVIRIQDRDLAGLPPAARDEVRRTQRRYVEIWVEVLRQAHPRATAGQARTCAHAVFGLLNSTPHSAGPGAPPGTRAVLRAMAVAALDAGGAPQ
ncbi:MAG: TetR/AcrR family transcriptional regulator [Kineosporiaceae bacterium]